jgi:hypothetical protein
MYGHAGAASYNYFLNASNDGGVKAVHFVNGSTRTADGGANAYVIRNDGGKFILGAATQVTEILGSSGGSANWNTAYSWGDHASGGYASNVFLTNTGGAKLEIQNSTDGGSSKGIYMWNTADPNWGIYMAQAGTSRALNDGNAAAGIDGRTEHAIRFRAAKSTSQIGFLWENNNQEALMQLVTDTGKLFTRGSIYPSNQTTAYVDSTRIGNWNTAYGWGDHGVAGYLTSTLSAAITLDNNGYFVGSPSYGFRFNNSGDTINALIVDNSGNSIAYASHRAPIFYDSNDTNYYLDPNGQSKIADLATGNQGILAAGYALTAYDSSRYLIGFRYSGADTNYPWLVHDNYDGVSALQFHFNAIGDRFQFTESGNGYAYDSFRAPIFYDSNDTGYYADPAGTSRLHHAETPNGSEFIHCKHSGSDFADGTLVKTDIPANSSEGASYIIEATGKSYSGEPPFAFKAQGYLYSNTIINHSGVSYGKALGNNQIKVFNHSDNKLAFWWPRVSYWNSFEVRVRDAGGSARNRALTVVNSTEPSSSKKVTTTLTQAALLGHNYGSGSLYSDRVYDQNDTGYYLDPNSATRLSALKLEPASATNQASGSDNVLWIYRTSNNDWGIQVDADQNDATDYGYEFLGGSSHTYAFSAAAAGTRYFNVGSTYAQHNGDFRAPIFYDSNNTLYYTNPNSQSSMYGVAVRGDLSSTATGNQIFFWGGGDSTTSAIGFKANGGYFTNPTGNGDGYNTYLTMDTAGRGWVFRQGTGSANFTSLYNSGWILNNGIWQANASMRAPIFYDSNNTGYYVHGDSGSSLLRLGLNVAPDMAVAGDILKIQGGNNGLGCVKAISGQYSYGVRIEGSNLSTQLALYTSSTSQTTQINFEVAGNSSAGKISTTTNTTTYTTSSDYRLKENIIPISDSISRLNQLKPSRFNFIGEPNKTVDGFIAHEVQDIVPEAIVGEKDEVDDDGNPIYQGIDQAKLVPLLVAAIKELEARVQELENN